MDTQKPTAQPVITPANPLPPIKPKQSGITLLIILIFVLAMLGTGLAYLFIPQNGTKKVTTTAPAPMTPTPTPRENAKWQAYSNTKYHYSFAYPVTWKMTSTDPKNFELEYTAGPDLGIIKGSYFTADERSKLGQAYCDANADPVRCHTYKLTVNSSVMLDRLTSNNTANDKANALITLSNGDFLQFQITDGNRDSYNTLTILLDTLLFPNEKKAYPMQICPDTWPVNGTTIDYNGVKFPTEDVDAAWIKDNCKYPIQ